MLSFIDQNDLLLKEKGKETYLNEDEGLADLFLEQQEIEEDENRKNV